MASREKPYGDINIFSAISPLAIMLCAYLAELLFGEQSSKSTHEAIGAIATVFTFGLIPFSLISYATFKYFVLPALNYLPSKMQVKSYFFNVVIVLIASEIIFVLMFVAYNGVEKLVPLFVAAAIPTALIALNCFGHICFFKFKSRMKQNA